jgi:hypothetical protein
MNFRRTFKTSFLKKFKDFFNYGDICAWLSSEREDYCAHPALLKDTNQEICSKCSSYCTNDDINNQIKERHATSN